MEALTAWLERYVLPVAAKIGAEKHLVALRDAFIGTMPATMAGAIAVMMNAIFRDLPPQFFPGYNGAEIPVVKEIIQINGFVWGGTLAMAGLIFAFSWGYNLSRAYDVNELAGGLVSFAATIGGLANSFKGALEIELPKAVVETINAGTADTGYQATAEGINVSSWGWLNFGHLGGNLYFTAMVMGFVGTMIFIKLMKANITIKMPDAVPPAVSKAFAAIIPATAALYVLAIFYWLFSKLVPDLSFMEWFQEIVAQPLLGFTQGYIPVLIVTLFVQIFWFFGIHGPNVLAPILEGIYTVSANINVNLFQEGGVDLVKEKGYIWVRPSFDAYSWFGGCGGTITLIIAILLFSKRADYLTVAKLSLAPGIFNINEPIMFGLPIVLNAIMFIPFLLAPLVSVSIGYFATYFGIVNPVSQLPIWVTPPLIHSFIATGGDWRAPLVSLAGLVATFLIWAPFVIAANKMNPNLDEAK